MAQHDYAIANQSGAAFRADLNNALSAIVSQNSGAAEPSTTFAYMRWADTTAGVMKMRNGANSAWITLYQLDGEWTSIALENGTAAAPSLYFKDSGTDTGVYSSGTDALDFATGGTRRVGISSTGDVTIYGQGDLRLADSDSSNWVALQAPATVSSNVTWTLPSTDGTNGQALKTNGSGTLTWGDTGGGKILQVVQATKLDTFSSSSTTGEDITGLSVTITPSSATSKILVMTDVKISGSGGGGGVLLLRGSTVIYQGDGSGSRAQYSHFSYGDTGTGIWYGNISASLNYLDSPASTSALTYKLQAKVVSASYPIYVNRTGYDAGSYAASLPSSLIVMEVAA